MLRWRHLLFVAALLFAQLAAGAHAVEHAAGNEKGVPTHACQLCLTAHDLGSGLPSVLQLPPVLGEHQQPDLPLLNDRSAWPAPTASQRAPPTT